MMFSSAGRTALVVALLSSLLGCADNENQEIKQWMDDTRREAKVQIPKVSEPKKFIPFAYGGRNQVDPYNPSKLALALAKMQSKSGSSFKPDLDRRREPLESYPLDNLKMVGTLQKPGLSYAILQADKMIFQAKVGNYVGQNFGMITKITDTEVMLKEIIQDGAGDWVEREAKLELQEIKK
jgi:type IV pilus assembly protein PilP